VGVMQADIFMVRVGIMVTHNPLYRSQRAELPHWALTLGSNVCRSSDYLHPKGFDLCRMVWTKGVVFQINLWL